MHQPIDSSYDLKFIRLSTGEDLIAEMIEIKRDDEAYYVLRNPLKVIYMTSSRNNQSLTVSLMQWVFHRICESQEFVIYPGDIITVGSPTKSMSEYYYNSIEHFEEVKEENKRLSEIEKHKNEYLEEEAISDGEGIEMLKELFKHVRKINPNGGTLH